MRLLRLTVENFRKFRHAEIEFPDGVVGLVGRNGAGKSSLIEAIGWALFGHEAARTGKDLIKRRGATAQEDCRVTLAFEFGGVEYVVARELLGKNASHVARLTANGALVVPPGAQSQREVTSYLERAFHMDRTSFFTSLVARQRELNALSDMTPGNRQRVVLAMLRIDAVDDAIRLAREAKRDLRARLDAVASQLADPKALEARAADLVSERAHVSQRLSTLDAAVAEGEARAAAAREAREASVKRHEAHAVFAVAVADRKARAEAAERELAEARADLARFAALAVELGSLAPKAALLPEARAALERATVAAERHAEAERRARELAEAEKARAASEAALAEARAAAGERLPARKAHERVREGLAKAREELVDAQRKVSEVDARLAQRRAEAERVGAKRQGVVRLGSDSPCPTCTRTLGEHYAALVATFDGELASLRAVVETDGLARADAAAAEAATRQRFQDLTERERELTAKVQELAAWESRAKAVEARLASERERAERLAEALRALAPEPVAPDAVRLARARVDEHERAAKRAGALEGQLARRADVERTVELLAERAERARTDLWDATEALRQLAFDPVAHAAAVKAAEAALAELAERRLARERARSDLARVADAEVALASERERQGRLARDADALRLELAYLERLAGDRDAGLLVEFKASLISRVRPMLSAHAGAAFRELTDGKYSDLEVDEAYSLVVADDGERFGLERFSGGESDLANLCLRLAVSRVIAERAGGADFQFIALDEIFGSQDEVRKANILRALSSLSSRFRQILVITHIEDVKESCERVIRVEEQPDGTSLVTVE